MLKHTIVILFITSEDRGVLHSYRPFSCQQESPPCCYCLGAALKFTSGSVQIKMMLQMEVVTMADTLFQLFPVKSTQLYGADAR